MNSIFIMKITLKQITAAKETNREPVSTKSLFERKKMALEYI